MLDSRFVPVSTDLRAGEREQLRLLFLEGAQNARVRFLRDQMTVHATNQPATDAERDLRDLLSAIAVIVERP